MVQSEDHLMERWEKLCFQFGSTTNEMGGLKSRFFFFPGLWENEVIGLEVLQGSSEVWHSMMFWNCRIPGKRMRWGKCTQVSIRFISDDFLQATQISYYC